MSPNYLLKNLRLKYLTELKKETLSISNEYPTRMKEKRAKLETANKNQLMKLLDRKELGIKTAGTTAVPIPKRITAKCLR